MADPAPTAGEFESESEARKHGTGEAALWLKHIERAKKDEKDWREQAKKAVAIYEAQSDDTTHDQPAFNILHSNIEVTVPALYNSTPIPDVRRRYGDADPVGKLAVDVIERALSYLADTYDFDATVSESVRDSELAGRGFARVRYEPETVEQKDSKGEVYPSVGKQVVRCEHVPWDRWGHGPARQWSEVPWVYFEHDLTRDDLEKLGVGKERIDRLTFNDTDRNDDDKSEKASAGVWKTLPVYEVWDRKRRRVLFVTPQDKQELITEKPDPLGLEQFFPGKPLQSLRRRRDITPICPYSIYEPQIEELDRVQRRITSLVGQIKVRGMVDSRLKAALELIKDCSDGEYVPADDATMFAQGGGGLERAVAHWPIEPIVAALQQVYVQRDQIKQIIYEITGLSDVLRGATDPRETLGAQQLKAQSGSQRLSTRQAKVARFCRDLFRLMAEIMCRHFSAENLSAMTGVQLTPEVEQLLRNDILRGYRIDIESDSTIRADVARSQEQMTLFLQGTAQYAQSMASVLELAPGATPALVEIYAAFARNFKLGKSAEDALDKLVQMAQQPQEPKPDPEQQKLQAEQQRMQMQAQMEQQKFQMQAQAEAEKGQREAAKAQADMQIKREMAAIDREMKMVDLEVAREKAAIEFQKAQADMAMKREAMELDREAKVYDIKTKREMSGIDIEGRRQKSAADADARAAKAEEAGAAE
jgi:hypothetical protein